MIIDENTKTAIEGYFEKLTNTVYISLVNADLNKDKALKLSEFISEIANCSKNIVVESATSNLVPDYPAIGVSGRAGEYRVFFAGLPLGHELTSFILAVLWAGGVTPKVTEEDLQWIKSIDIKKNLKTYVSLTCHNCPDIVQSLTLAALYNDNISHVMVEGGFNQDVISDLNILAVPEVYSEGHTLVHAGKASFKELFSAIFSSSTKKISAKLSAKTLTQSDREAIYSNDLNTVERFANHPSLLDVVVVGAGPAGMTSAIYLARKGKEVAVIGTRIGGQLNETQDIENFIGTSKTTGTSLANNLKSHSEDYSDKIILEEGVRVTDISKKAKNLFLIGLDDGSVLLSKTVIIATGATWKKLEVPGEDKFRGKGVAYCPHCDGPFFKGKDVVVSGGGNSGVEAAIDLAGIVRKVTLIQRNSELKADSVLVEKLNKLPNVDIITNSEVVEIKGNKVVTAVDVINNKTSKVVSIDTSAIFVQIGLSPNTGWLSGSEVSLTSYGEIIVDKNNETSCKGVFAAGDVTTAKYKQIVSAIGDGANAALSLFDTIS